MPRLKCSLLFLTFCVGFSIQASLHHHGGRKMAHGYMIPGAERHQHLKHTHFRGSEKLNSSPFTHKHRQKHHHKKRQDVDETYDEPVTKKPGEDEEQEWETEEPNEEDKSDTKQPNEEDESDKEESDKEESVKQEWNKEEADKAETIEEDQWDISESIEGDEDTDVTDDYPVTEEKYPHGPGSSEIDVTHKEKEQIVLTLDVPPIEVTVDRSKRPSQLPSELPSELPSGRPPDEEVRRRKHMA